MFQCHIEVQVCQRLSHQYILELELKDTCIKLRTHKSRISSYSVKLCT